MCFDLNKYFPDSMNSRSMKMNTTSPKARAKNGSSFTKNQKTTLSIIGTSGLVLGFGAVTGGSAAAVNGSVECTDENTVIATSEPTENFDNILEALVESSLVCLDGDFTISEAINIDDGELLAVQEDESVHFYGVGESSLGALGNMGVLVSDEFQVTIENLAIKESSAAGLHEVVGLLGAVVWGGSVVVKNSTFSENTGRAILSYGSVSISESTFVNNNKTNLNLDGGAVFAFGSVSLENSTFIGNKAYSGGAVYVLPLDVNDLDVTNSTFKNNVVTGDGAEGGALFAMSGQVIFSTFVENEAPPKVEGQEVPGNSIYKYGSSNFNVGGNIFAGSGDDPQLGYGNDVSPFTDLGGNVFTTTSATETDITQDDSSVFEASLNSIFGTNTPTLEIFSPNSSGTQTIGLVAGSPALNIVPNEVPFTSVTTDQRGATRSHPADAGAFEFIATPAATTPAAPSALAKTGNESQLWMSIASAALVSFGGLALGLRSRLRRRISQ